ncbi:Receptor family ligand binding region [Aquisphaera giovannonii]|uniref:Receptor family ligand binding region n=1 Tax=Aquisphaera giovannonii TaxID=406548 RepID=A0A5B9W7X9_9BACT|nr:Receptor family ligand binding region [Aquisphaera giovannonii]
MQVIYLLLAAYVWAIVQAPSAAQTPSSHRVEPYVDFRDRATPYSGPGRELAEPKETKEVLLGYFGPDDSDHAEGGAVWRGADMAIRLANVEGGYRGKPFRLAASWSDNPWKGGVGGLARMAHREKAWAILGGIDGPSAHLAEQVVAKANLPLVCPLNGDRTANGANVPWFFSAMPADHLQAPVLADALVARSGPRGFAFVSTPDHDPRAFLVQLDRALKARKASPRFSHVLAADNPDFGAAARQVVAEDVGAVMIAANARDSAGIARELRNDSFRGPILGGHWMGRSAFARLAGPAAEGVVFPLVCDPDAMPASFRSEYETRYHEPPDYAAAHGFDAANLLVEAVRSGGLNRARIGDALRSLSPYPGVSGTIAWDSLGSNTRPVSLATIRDGKVDRFTAR